MKEVASEALYRSLRFSLKAGSSDPATLALDPSLQGGGKMRHILKTIPFPRLRLAGDDTQSDPQCQTLSVMAGLVPAIHAFNLRKDVDARHKAGHDDRGSFPAAA